MQTTSRHLLGSHLCFELNVLFKFEVVSVHVEVLVHLLVMHVDGKLGRDREIAVAHHFLRRVDHRRPHHACLTWSETFEL